MIVHGEGDPDSVHGGRLQQRIVYDVEWECVVKFYASASVPRLRVVHPGSHTRCSVRG